MAFVEEPPVVPATDTEDLKVFVGGIPFHFGNIELKQAFERFGATEAVVMIDRRTNKSRGFGFVMFADPIGRDEAISHMHDTELDSRRISVTKAIPQDQTAPGTPAAALGGGRREGAGGYVARDRAYARPFDRGGYDRGYDRGEPYDRYDRQAGGPYARTRPYEPRYPAYGSRPYDFRDPYPPRDPYLPAYEFDRGGGYRGMNDRPPYSGGYDDRYRPAPGPDRRQFGGAGYDRGVYDRGGMRR